MEIEALCTPRTVRLPSLSRNEFSVFKKNDWKHRKLIFIKIIIPPVCFLLNGQRA